MFKQKLMGRGLARESIQFQSPQFFHELTSALNQALDSQEANPKLLSEIVKNYTNLENVTFDLNKAGPYVTFPVIDKNNVLVTASERRGMSNDFGIRLIKEVGGHAKGWVNLETGKVGGVYTQIPVVISLPIKRPGYRLDGEKTAATCLHEIGHVLVFLEFLGRSVSTNAALAGLVRELDRSNTQVNREAVLTTVQGALKLKDLDPKSLSEISDVTVLQTVIIARTSQKARSELGSNIYDETTWEYLADQYATRMGAGRALAVAYDLEIRTGNNIATRTLGSYLYMEAVKVLKLAAANWFYGMTGFILGPVGTILGALYLFSWASAVVDDMGPSATYDTPKARVQRIRNQIVEAIKVTGDDRVRMIELKNDLEVLDEILSDLNDYRQFSDLILRHIFQIGRSRDAAFRLQSDLEQLASNDIFVRAAELKTL